MVQVGTSLKVIDNTGVLFVKCIKILGNGKIFGKVGTYIVVVVKNYRVGVGLLKDERKWKRFMAGTKHIALVIHTKNKFKRSLGLYLWFSENTCILVNKKKIPLGTRIRGPVVEELGKKNLSLLSMADEVI